MFTKGDRFVVGKRWTGGLGWKFKKKIDFDDGFTVINIIKFIELKTI